MKKLFILCAVIANSLFSSVSAATYLISPTATETNATITHKGESYTVGITAFPDFAALAAVSPEENSTVIVAPGTYSTEATFSTAGLTFLGNNAYQDWTVTRGEESIITAKICIEASNITVNGFKFTEKGQLYSNNATNTAPFSNIKIIYNYVSGATLERTKSYGVFHIGKRASNKTAPTDAVNCRYKDCVIAHNYFEGDDTHYSNNIQLAGSFGTTQVYDNYFYYGGTSVLFDNAQGEIKVFNNVFKNVGASTASSPDGETAGDFCVALMRSAYANSTTLYIQSNEFDGCYGQGGYFCPIRIFPGTAGSTNLVDPQNLRININYNTFKNQTSYVSTNTGNVAGEYLLLYADATTTKNVRYNLAHNHYDNRFYKYAHVTLDDGLGQREIYASHFARFRFGSDYSTFGKSSLNSVEETNHATNVTLGDNTVLQSFDIDTKTGDMYFQQVMNETRTTAYNNIYGFSNGNHEPLVVTRIPCTGISGYAHTYSSNVEKMEVGKAGHGTNMCLVRDSDGELWIWAGGKAEDNETEDDKSTATARFKFAAETDINFDGSGNTDGDVVYFDVNNSKNEYPAVDETSRLLCVRTTSSTINTYHIYDLDDALKGTKTKFKKVVLNKLDYPQSKINGDNGYLTWSFQSFDICGDYIYMLEGVSNAASNSTESGKPTLIVTTYNWRTDNYVERYRLDYGRINGTYGEPEGFVIKPDAYGHVNAYVVVATGSSGARKANVYKFIIDYHRQWDSSTGEPTTVGSDTEKISNFSAFSNYPVKNPAISFSTDVQQIDLTAAATTDRPQQTVTITNANYLHGSWHGTVTGTDADAFDVTISENTPFSTTATATVTFKPDDKRVNYNAYLRLHSPLATSNVESNDIVIPITAKNNDMAVGIDKTIQPDYKPIVLTDGNTIKILGPEIEKADLYSTCGKLIGSYDKNSFNANCANGIYLIAISYGNGLNHTQKIVIR